MAGLPLSIGFEAHDGSGKTTTAEILALMLGNAPTWIPDSKTQNYISYQDDDPNVIPVFKGNFL